MDVIFFIVFLCLGAFVYFLPAIIGRRKPDSGAIFALNLLCGWTFAGWIIALVWAMRAEARVVVAVQPGVAFLPIAFWGSCGARLQVGAQFCSGCGRRV